MTMSARSPWLDGIASQITTLLVVAISLSTLASVAIVLLTLTEHDFPAAASEGPTRIATIAGGLDGVPSSARPALAAALTRDRTTVGLLDDAESPDAPGQGAHPLKARVIDRLPPGVRLLRITTERPEEVRVLVRLGDGQVAAISTPFSKLALLPLPLIMPFIFLLVSASALSVWAGRRLVGPLSRFADAADGFGRDGADTALAEGGPLEVRRAASAFNRMRERIGRLIEDRTNLLLAISHDLRTPLTRMRLRLAELQTEDTGSRERLLEDIASMDSSITAAVTYLREGIDEEPEEVAELSSILNTICDQFTDAGFAVEYVGPPRLTFRCRPHALERAVTNLVDNATKYGTAVRVTLQGSDGGARIDVDDDGPGIPATEKARVLEPFYRADPARQVVRGFGLGLAIVAGIVRRHGGTLELLDNEPRGLRVRVELPVR
jgi:signal transduction histidine kinase